MASASMAAEVRGGVSARDADAMSRRGFSFRLGFAVLAAFAATLVTPLSWLFIWLLLIVVWEVWLAQFLTNTLVWPVYERDGGRANWRQAAIVALGAALFGAFPFLTWASGTMLGAILAVAWIGGTAIHVFVYLSNHRAQLIVALAPPLAAALILPAMSLGASLQTLAASLAVLYLIGAAAVFAIDRNALLVDMTRQAAAREAAEQTAHAKTEFLHALTHHLRTPLNHIIGYAGLLGDDIRGATADANDAAKIAAAGKHLLDLVNRAIEISRLQAGAIELDPERVSLAELLEDASAQIAQAAAQSGNQVVVGACPDEIVVVDRDRVLECLFCLTENAAKFCTNGVITLSVLRLGGDVGFTVADTGPGMSEAALARIEAPFSLGEEAPLRAQEGLGLGLTHCRELARALGGGLHLESAPGQGTRAQLRLAAPLHKA